MGFDHLIDFVVERYEFPGINLNSLDERERIISVALRDDCSGFIGDWRRRQHLMGHVAPDGGVDALRPGLPRIQVPSFRYPVLAAVLDDTALAVSLEEVRARVLPLGYLAGVGLGFL